MTWTEERVERLKDLWAEGYGASRIAGMMRGVSRSAVYTKAHRLSACRTGNACANSLGVAVIMVGHTGRQHGSN